MKGSVSSVGHPVPQIAMRTPRTHRQGQPRAAGLLLCPIANHARKSHTLAPPEMRLFTDEY